MDTVNQPDTYSPGELVFRNWELVSNIFSYLPWYEVCRMRDISQETRWACQYSVKSIGDPKKYNLDGKTKYFILHFNAFYYTKLVSFLVSTNKSLQPFCILFSKI